MKPAPAGLTEVAYSFATGGSEKVSAAIAEYAWKSGIETTMCATHGGRGATSDYLESIGVPCVTLESRWGGRLSKRVQLYRHLRSSGSTILHVHHFNMMAIAYLPARLAGVSRIVVTEHSNHLMRSDPASKENARHYGPQADAITVVHQGLADYLASEIGLDEAKISVVPNGVDTVAFAPRRNSRLRRQLGFAPEVVLVTSVGRLHPDKDPVNLIHAIAHAFNSGGRNLRLVFVGEGECRPEMEKIIQERGLQDIVLLVGERKDIPDVLASTDIFALPSRTEGLPVALLEAMSCGVAVVATAVGGVPSAIDGAGEVVAPQDPESMGEAILRLSSNPGQRIALGELARQRAVAAFDESQMYSGYAGVLWGGGASGASTNLDNGSVR